MADRHRVPTSVAPLPPTATPLHAREAATPTPGAAAPRAPRWIGTSASLNRAVDALRRFARSGAAVLVLGESGTGKELAAAEVHARSGRRGRFVALNCGALTESLAASQLFGHARGAFTGAVGQHRGAFVRASGGTLFLDEIGELPPAIQSLLLRVLETRRVCPVGAEIETTVDARIVCATHRDLAAMVDEGTFRADLYHRLSVLQVRMPPLRARPDDVDALLDHFAQEHASDVGHPIAYTSSARREARRAAWPGNVRELRNAVHRAAFLSRGCPITEGQLLPRPAHPVGDTIRIPRGTFEQMRRALLHEVIEREGSQRRAADVLDLPRSTLGNWLRDATG
jgi:two-component system response regulator HydG